MKHNGTPHQHAGILSHDGGIESLESSTIVMCIDNDDDVKVLECQHQKSTDAEENNFVLDGFCTCFH
jgi:hypothetical protein